MGTKQQELDNPLGSTRLYMDLEFLILVSLLVVLYFATHVFRPKIKEICMYSKVCFSMLYASNFNTKFEP